MTLSASVLIDGPRHLEFSYAIPDDVANHVAIGSRVRVPLQNRSAFGTILAIGEETQIDPASLKPLTALLDDQPVLTPNLVQLARWIAAYYSTALETVIRSVLPEAVRSNSHSFKKRKAAQLISPCPLDKVQIDSLQTRAPRQAEVLAFLQSHSPDSPTFLTTINKEIPGAAPALKALEKKGVLTLTDKVAPRDPHAADNFLQSNPLPLNPQQAGALHSISQHILSVPAPSPPKPFLLHGVTGSGKTEVYLQAIQKVLDLNQTALVLVPEIALTPQTVERFKRRFASIQQQIAVLHSHLSQGERFDEWHKINQKNARVVIGARSAIFAPLNRLGLIIVDEEHENSYKQENPPRYHARDVATVRGQIEKCPVILGSATPSLESWHNAQRGKYHLLTLDQRADDRKLPLIRVADMRNEARKKKDGIPSLLSEHLRIAILKRLDQNEQVILFLNRRGFATSLVCQECGYVCQCRHCSVPLTFHRTDEKLLCHICGFQQVAPAKCPECHSRTIRFSGYGTQKIEDLLHDEFHGHRIARVDADSMRRKNELRDTLRDFKARKIQILLGTQMIAKGLHFPNVTLVGILNADLGLHMPDFRAGERTFQLLTQVAGRAGRGDRLGEVIVQTHTPQHPAIQFARHHDYHGFAEQELPFRKEFQYPPYLHALLITVRSPHERRAQFSAETLAKRLRPALPESVLVTDPLPSPLVKAAGQFRFQIMLRSPSTKAMTDPLSQVLQELSFPEDVLVVPDIDPYSLM
ncbi:MAG: primosomal protein N' [Verrucomicrobiota bacterium]